MPKRIDANDLNDVEDMELRIAHLQATLTLFMKQHNRAAVERAIPELKELINNFHEDNIQQIREEFAEKYNSVLDDSMPDVSYK
jgi:hypothetical protein